MKILIASDTYYPHVNGCSYFTQRLAEALAKRGHEVAVISPGPEFASTIRPHGNVTHYGVRSFPILIVPHFRFVLPVISGISGHVARAVRELEPDIVHIQMHFPISRMALRGALAAGIPVVATNHFMPDNLTHYLHLPRRVTEGIHSLAWRDAARTYRKTRGVSAPTRTAGVMLEPWLGGPVMTISNGIDLVRFNPHNDPAPAKKEYGLPEKPTLLFVGRLDKEKNVDVVLRAIAKIKDTVDIHFTIAGHGAESARLKKLAQKLDIENNVTFLGFVPDTLLPSLYAAADCFVNAGIAELQCIVAMEAMATGLPVVGARAVALPELIHHGENGFLFEPSNSAELAEQLVKMFGDPALRERMGNKSLEIISGHALDMTLETFEEFYRKAIAK
ncbi:MAG: glycosyltransferase [bacterium]|nr:glycosyltransferase [bacterium]